MCTQLSTSLAAAAHSEYIAMAPPPDTPTSEVIISEDSEVFTEGALDMPGATVEIVETSPMMVSQPKTPKKKSMPAYREQLLLRWVSLLDDFLLPRVHAQQG